ncbi:MAG TPA: prolyl oligopeptidase family serine peptidase [Blastocatellia bacterium]|nr:prolyl oligopeptidase family serine peptidase [Blastocatellia bacterium]HMZ18761.1 prolyl oligopeptidase family serine peptidase [Blastocatellia bacterium]
MQTPQGLAVFWRCATAFICAAVLGLAANVRDARAQSDEIAPPKNMEVSGVPKIPAALAKEVKRYLGAYGLPLAGWHSEKCELWLKGISSVTWLTRIEAPETSQKVWLNLPFSGIYDVYFQPQAKHLLYNRDVAGDENFQLYLYELATKTSTLISEPNSRNTEPIWSNAGTRVVWSYSPAKGNGVSLAVGDPFEPNSRRVLVQTTGNYLKAFSWSPDDKQIAACEFIGNTRSRLWLVNAETGEKRLLSSKAEKTDEYYDTPQFSLDGKGLFVFTDRESDVRRLVYLDLASGQFKTLTPNINWDVDEIQLSPDGKTLAFVVNENGVSRLYLLDTKTFTYQPVSSLPLSVISDLKWHNNSNDLAFNLKSPRTPNDVYALDVKTGKLERWGRSFNGGLALDKLPLPELIRWKSFDGRMISGFLYRSANAAAGKRPVIIDIHGGPEDQYKPVFGYEDNYFINELGIVKIYPNVRGSIGYGKQFLNLDNGLRREDSVKDIGTLLDWIKTQPDLDAERVLIQGSSYGGYMALSVATKYDHRIRGAISDAGAANLATFIERTEGWRRELRRAEFGDERDPKIRDFMEKIAPLNNVRKIKKPLLILQGKNDPRVAASEAEAIVNAARQQGTPTWYVLANDEGHSFVKQANRDFRLYSLILFVQERLLSQQANPQLSPLSQRPNSE